MIIPIGIQCTNGNFKREINKATKSYPFDWIFSPPKFIYEMLYLLLEKNMEIDKLVKEEFFLCDTNASVNVNFLENYYTDINGFALLNSKYNVVFPHDVRNNETIEKYVRRFERLKVSILNSNEKIIFLYSSQASLNIGNYTVNNTEVITNVYYYLSKIQNLLEKYNNNFKIIIFDTIKNEDKKLLNDKIMLIELNESYHWIDIINQMLQHKHHFE